MSPEENEKTSRKVFTISKNYARDTGPVKPGSLYPEDTSRGALKMTKTRASDTGTTRPGIVYSEKRNIIYTKA